MMMWNLTARLKSIFLKPDVSRKALYTPLAPLKGGINRVSTRQLRVFSLSNGLRWNAVFVPTDSGRFVAQILSIIIRKVSVWWTQERPGLHSHAERGNEISQNRTCQLFRWYLKNPLLPHREQERRSDLSDYSAALLLAFIILPFIFACGKKTEKVQEIPLTLIDSWGGARVDTQAMIGYPGDFIVSSKGEVVVTDVRLHQVLFFDREGNIIRRVGKPGRGPLEFAIPDDIAQIGDELVIWDYQNNRLQFLTLNGEFISTSTPAPRIDFNAKTFDRHGRLYYATGGFRADSLVYVYTRDGEFAKTFGALEGGKFTEYHIVKLKQSVKNHEIPAALKNAALLCATSDDGIFVAHTALPVVKKYSISGKKLFDMEMAEPEFKQQRDDFFAANDTLPDFSLKPLRFWIDITADKAGGVFILQNKVSKMIVFHFDANGKLLEKYYGPNENISKIFFDGSELWAIGRENLVFYRFSLTPPDELATDETE